MSLSFQTAWETASLIAGKEISPLEVMRGTLEYIEAVNPELIAFAALRPEEALKEAYDMSEAMAKGKTFGPLAGVPIGVKDLEDVAGMVTSYGSLCYRNNIASADSVQVARLKAAGAIVVGKTNVPEFGFTGFTKNRLYGITRNPFNLERTSGGSSGGSAAAVAGGLVPIATGSDSGGSIRIPASYCGCFGMKPTFGRIPAGPSPCTGFSGLTSFGPLTRSVRDAALYLDCASGSHPADPYSLSAPTVSYAEILEDLPEHLNIAFSPNLGYAVVQKEVLSSVENAVRVFEEMGHGVTLWSGTLPELGDAWPVFFASDIYTQVKEIPENERGQIGRSLSGILDEARRLTVEEITVIQKRRALLNAEIGSIFETFDLLLTPTMPGEAFRAEAPPPETMEGRRLAPLGDVAFTYPFNFSGHPAATLPAGFTPSGLPVGLQIIAPRHRDDLVLQASYAFEKASPWNGRRPDLMPGLCDIE